jgi:hypothetical protein
LPLRASITVLKEKRVHFFRIRTINSYVTETRAVHFSTYMRGQTKFTYRVFTEFISLWDVAENYSNTNKTKTTNYLVISTEKLPNYVDKLLYTGLITSTLILNIGSDC